MTRTDYKVIFTALGFLAVVQENVPRDRQVARATALAELIEAFCVTAIPDAFASDAPQSDVPAVAPVIREPA